MVGVDGDLGHVFHALYVSFAAQMHERLVRQPCLVGIECVFLILSVDGDKALVVLAVFAAFCSCIGAEVEHIPNVGCPDVLAAKELLDELFVVVCLVFFGVVALLWVACVPVERFAAIFGAADRNARMHFVELIEPGAVHMGLAAVPTEVVVVGNNVGDLQIGIVHLAHGNGSDGGLAGFVHFVDEVV